mmetsp:Transcript_23817/g.64894  ORF Transcript_23817/g.64894 Transcript_23817/m.64894 type:complete len:250 (-) Transcript_23817:141-890(-)
MDRDAAPVRGVVPADPDAGHFVLILVQVLLDDALPVLAAKAKLVYERPQALLALQQLVAVRLLAGVSACGLQPLDDGAIVVVRGAYQCEYGGSVLAGELDLDARVVHQGPHAADVGAQRVPRLHHCEVHGPRGGWQLLAAAEAEGLAPEPRRRAGAAQAQLEVAEPVGLYAQARPQRLLAQRRPVPFLCANETLDAAIHGALLLPATEESRRQGAATPDAPVAGEGQVHLHSPAGLSQGAVDPPAPEST